MNPGEPNALAKTTRINALFDFYEPLLTDKQRTFLRYYFLDDFSLGEIASEFQISRQAVYEHVKRAEQALENYESKLGLLIRHEAVQGWLGRLDEALAGAPDERVSTEELRLIAQGIRLTIENE